MSFLSVAYILFLASVGLAGRRVCVYVQDNGLLAFHCLSASRSAFFKVSFIHRLKSFFSELIEVGLSP